MNPRLRRLVADHQQVLAAFGNHPKIRVLQAEGNPPEKYVVAFGVKGLVPLGEDSWIEGHEHRAEIFLPVDYPRRAPFCRMITPVFHPNIDSQKICIGDHWSAGQKLSQLIVRIGEMITYQSYNVQSPLNAKAAAWSQLNASRLPLETADLTVGL